jgi:hypothetical protein
MATWMLLVEFLENSISKDLEWDTNNQIPWPDSASELYSPSDRRLSAKLVPTFADRRVQRSQSGGSLRP